MVGRALYKTLPRGALSIQEKTEMFIKFRETIVIKPSVSDSTVRRRVLAEELADEFMKLENVRPIEILKFLEMIHTPASAHTMAVTLQSLPRFKSLKEDRDWSEALKKLHLTKTKTITKQAVDLTATALKRVLEDTHNKNAVVVGFLWISASRYGDLQHVTLLARKEIPEHEATIMALCYRGTKGDPQGKRGDAKAIIMPTTWANCLASIIKTRGEETISKTIPSSYMVKKALARGDESLTLHSARRGAAKALLPTHRLTDIALLTLHGQRYRQETVSTEVYTKGLWFKEEREVKQMRMSLYLLHTVGMLSTTKMNAICKEWCSMARNTNFTQLEALQE